MGMGLIIPFFTHVCPFPTFCFGNWRMLLEDSTSERRGRNFADCIFAIPLQEKDSFKEMFLAKEAKVAFPPMPHWLQQQT